MTLNWAVTRMPLWGHVSWVPCAFSLEGFNVRNVAVNDLGHAEAAAVGDKVKGLGLDIGRVHDLPLEVVAGQLSVGLLGRLLGDGADGRGAVDGLLGAGHIGQPGKVSKEEAEMRPGSIPAGNMAWSARGRCDRLIT